MKGGIERAVLVALAFLFTFMVFLLDYHSDSKHHISILYVLIILYSWLLPGRFTVTFATTICMALTFVVALKKYQIEEESQIILNAILSSVGIWVAMFLTLLSRRGYDQLKITIANLDETVSERTIALRTKLIDTEIQNKLIQTKNRENLALNKELKAETARVEKNRRRFQNLMKEAPTGILIVSRKGEILDANEFIENRLTGEKEIRSQNILNLVHEDDTLKLENLLQELSIGSEQDGKSSVEIRFSSMIGSERYFPAEVSLAYLEAQNMDEIIVTIFDLSERKAKEEMKLRSTAMEIKNKEVENMAYLASHDLRQPLSSIAGLAELLDEMVDSDSEMKPFIGYIKGATVRMNELITQLLGFSQLGSSERAEIVDMNKLVEEVLIDLQNLIKTSDAQINLDNLPPVKNASPFELRILLQNLINNAIKFNKKDRTPEVRIGHKTMGSACFYFVSDNGIGISTADQDKIFGMFKRLHGQNDYEGTGIGLAYCKKIVEAHEGRLILDSTLGKGSTFYFSLNENLPSFKTQWKKH